MIRKHTSGKRFMALLLTLSMLLSLVPGMAFAEGGEKTPAGSDTEAPFVLEDGTYQSLVDITDWNENNEISNGGIKISQKVFITVSEQGKKAKASFQVGGFSQYDAIYMVKQSANDSITEIDLSKGGKIGDLEITDYDKYKEAGFVNSALTNSYEKITPKVTDKAMDTAIFEIDFDYQDKIGIVGFLKHSKDGNDENMKEACSTVTFRATPMATERTQITSCISDNITNLPLFVNVNNAVTDTVKIYAKEKSWNTRASKHRPHPSLSVLYDDSFKKVEYSIDDNKLHAKLFLKDDLKDDLKDIKVFKATGKEFDTEKANYLNYISYLAGHYGTTYDSKNNLYNSNENCINVSFTPNELMYGKDLEVCDYTIDGKKSSNNQYINICLSEKYYGPKKLTDDKFGLIYVNGFKQFDEQTNFVVTDDVNNPAIKAAIKSIQETCGEEGDYKVYKWDLLKNNEQYTPSITGWIYIPIPDDWDTSQGKLYAELLEEKDTGEGIKYIQQDKISNPKIEEINGHNYLAYQLKPYNLEPSLHKVTIGICQKREIQDISTLGEGTYKIDAAFLRKGTSNGPSMADSTLQHNNAHLVVDGSGNKSVYLNFKPLNLTSTDLAYMGALWNTTDQDVTYYDFETNENGALLDNAGFNALTEFPCVKSARIDLHPDSWDGNARKYSFNVIPPAMSVGAPFDEVYHDPIGADLVVYGYEKIGDSTSVQMPTYQKSILRRSIDKAKIYIDKTSNYTADSVEKLVTALSEGESYYNSIQGDAGTNQEISNNIKDKSDAIEEAIKNLTLTESLAQAKETLKNELDNAKTVDKGNKTDTAYNQLQSTIASAQAVYTNDGATVEEVKGQTEALKKAVEIFNSSKEKGEVIEQLANGKYYINGSLREAGHPEKLSMSDNAVARPMTLVKSDEGIKLQLDLLPITIGTTEGYLGKFSYFSNYDDPTEPPSYYSPEKVTPTVFYDVVDIYNNPNTGIDTVMKGKNYPKTVEIPVTLNDNEIWVQFYVPVMEGINPGSGTKNARLQLDWGTLQAADKVQAHDVTIENGKTSEKQYREGARVKIEANAPQDGYVFDKWVSDDVVFADPTSQKTTFVMPDKAVTVTATYKEKVKPVEEFNVTVTGGTADKQKYKAGETVTIKANDPKPGKAFKQWTGDGVEFADANAEETTFTMPAKAVNVTATYKDKPADPTVPENDKQWTIPVKMMNATKQNELSMGNSAIDGKATVTETDHGMEYKINVKGIEFSGLYGHLLEMWHYPTNDFDGNRQLATPSNQFQDKNLNGEQDNFYKTFTITRDGNEKESEIFIRIHVDAMEGFDQDAKLVFDWDGDQNANPVPGVTPEIKPGEEVENKDGSITKTEKLEDGTIVETTTNKPDGSTTEKTTKPDGTTIDKTTDKEGNINEKTEKPDGTTIDKSVKTDGLTTETTTTKEGKVSAEVTVPEGQKNVKVTIPKKDLKPGEVAVITKADGTKEVIKKSVAGEDGLNLLLDENTKLEIVDNSKTFNDVKEDNWANPAIDFVTSREIFNGTGDSTFAPEATMTRGMLVQVLYNFENRPEGSKNADFGDVKDDAWFADAVAWAADNKIVAGVGDNNFAPEQEISREQLVTILYRYAGEPKVKGSLDKYSDASKVSSYAQDAMLWAVENGIVSGMGDNTLAPQGDATRAQVAQIMMNFCDFII